MLKQSFLVSVVLAMFTTNMFVMQVTKDNLDAVLQQQIMDQFRKDNEALQEHLEQRKQKSLEDTKVTIRTI